jgi:hypothetical protein
MFFGKSAIRCAGLSGMCPFASTCADSYVLQACCGIKFHCMWHSSPYHWRRPDCNYYHFSPNANVALQALKTCWDRGTHRMNTASENNSITPGSPGFSAFLLRECRQCWHSYILGGLYYA